jgi:chromatin remodeling complex protein RSC6
MSVVKPTSASASAPVSAPASAKSAQTEFQAEFQETLGNLTQYFANICSKLVHMNGVSRGLQQDVKLMHRHYRKSHARLSKSRRKKHNTKIHLPMKVSKQLRKFLSLKASDLISKKDTMGLISAYVKNNNLQLESNRRLFKPNAALCKLFGLTKANAKPMTFVEINKYVSQHFASKTT